MRGEGKEVVKLLLSKGANINDTTNEGRNCFGVANPEIKSILEKWSHTMGVIFLDNLRVYNSIGQDSNNLHLFSFKTPIIYVY